jgi:Ca-activated chloride channel family protein
MRIVWLALLLVLGGWDLFRSQNPHVEQGNEHFRDGRYDQAIEAYRKAQAQMPEEPGIRFDLGVALYQKAMNTAAGPEREGLLAAASREFEQAGNAWDPKLKSAAAYNLGNTRFQEGKYAEAAEEYKKAIRRDPRNQDARYNLELALRRKQQQNQPPAPPEKQDDQSAQKPQAAPEEPEKPEQPQKNEASKAPEPQGEGKPGDKHEPQPPPQGGQEPKEPPENPKGQGEKDPREEGPEKQAPTQPPRPDEGSKGTEPKDELPPSGAAPKEGPEAKEAKEPKATEPVLESDRKLDALERRSKKLLIDRQRARASERRRGRYLKDW